MWWAYLKIFLSHFPFWLPRSVITMADFSVWWKSHSIIVDRTCALLTWAPTLTWLLSHCLVGWLHEGESPFELMGYLLLYIALDLPNKCNVTSIPAPELLALLRSLRVSDLDFGASLIPLMPLPVPRSQSPGVTLCVPSLFIPPNFHTLLRNLPITEGKALAGCHFGSVGCTVYESPSAGLHSWFPLNQWVMWLSCEKGLSV